MHLSAKVIKNWSTYEILNKRITQSLYSLRSKIRNGIFCLCEIDLVLQRLKTLQQTKNVQIMDEKISCQHFLFVMFKLHLTWAPIHVKNLN